MAALDNLSIAANVFQVVSFTDTVFRAGQALYELFNRARAASKNIAQLLLTLHALLSVIAHVRAFITDYASSPFAQEDGHALPHLRTILTLIEQDFRHIRGLLVETMGIGNEGRWSFFLVPMRWAFNESEIEDARQRLAQYTSHLSAALEVLGRRNDIALRTKLQSIEDKLCSISPRHPEPRPAHSTRSLFRIPRKQTKAIFPPVQAKHGNKALVKYTLGNERAGITAASPKASFPLHVAGVYPKIWIHEQPDYTYSFETDELGLRPIMKPALLLQDHLITALDTMRTSRVVRITSAQAEEFRLLFDLLVACAHSACADAVLQQYSQVLGPCQKQYLHSGRKGIVRHRDSRYRPVSLEEDGVTLNTTIGTIHANILSGRWDEETNTLAFRFQYLGSDHGGLSPFAVEYRSQALSAHSQPLFHQLEPVEVIRWRTACYALDSAKHWTLLATIKTMIRSESVGSVIPYWKTALFLRLAVWITTAKSPTAEVPADLPKWIDRRLSLATASPLFQKLDPSHIVRLGLGPLMTLLPPGCASFLQYAQQIQFPLLTQLSRSHFQSQGQEDMLFAAVSGNALLFRLLKYP